MSPDEYRAAIVQAALGELDSLNSRVADYWVDVGADEPYPLQWCGAFALWCLHEADCGLGVSWEIGRGFLLVPPHALRLVCVPQPGDVSYKPQPYQHHAIVERVVGARVYTVDGNQGPPSYIKQSSHLLGIEHSYFDVSPLIPAGDFDA